MTTFEKSRILAQSHLVIERLCATAAPHGFAAVSALGVVTAFAVAPNDDTVPAQLQTIVERPQRQPRAYCLRGANLPAEERIQRGDTSAGLTSRLGISDREAFEFIRTNATTQIIARQLRPASR